MKFFSYLILNLAGFPAHSELSSTSLVTKDPTAIIESLPILTAGKIIELAPIQTFWFIFMGFDFS